MKENIRLATKKDVSRVTELFNSDENLIGDNKIHYEKEDIKDYLDKKINKIFVYETDSKVVGVLLAQFWKNYILFDLIIVDKTYQGKGIGKAMLDYLELLSKKQKILLIETFTEVNNLKMQKIFERRGYKRGKTFYFYSKNLK